LDDVAFRDEEISERKLVIGSGLARKTPLFHIAIIKYSYPYIKLRKSGKIRGRVSDMPYVHFFENLWAGKIIRG
jgi:hypothetical protein